MFGRIVFGTTGVLVLAGAIAIAFGVRLNVTESMPLGLYREVPAKLERGELVVACLDDGNAAVAAAIAHGLLPTGNCPGHVAPVLKHIAAIAGDQVAITARGILVNGVLIQSTAPLPGNAGLPRASRLTDSPTQLHADQVILVAAGDRSFDSRYFGAVATAGIVNGAAPLLVTAR